MTAGLNVIGREVLGARGGGAGAHGGSSGIHSGIKWARCGLKHVDAEGGVDRS